MCVVYRRCTTVGAVEKASSPAACEKFIGNIHLKEKNTNLDRRNLVFIFAL